ncbi:hypothetical protein KP79_PYT06081 [Mizuhopecten yessoensis]|uniref:Uncharacterized protein n=1 Tax=Mizuhopecten yessoensis TaxID=6573 RepID=A0A210PXW7_MIZYE|nr:hypothetical protein KP79_PYT06081 [Mizuhopecten yessoensis]
MAFRGTNDCNCTHHFGNITNGDYNMTRTGPQVDTESKYDSIGALHFIVAVIAVYGVAVIGVFILGHFRRRGKHVNRDLDRQANYFLKQMPTIRESIEKRQRLSSIHQLLPNDLSYADDKNRLAVLGDGILKYISIPLLTNEAGGKLTNEKTPNRQETELELGYIGTINERSSSVSSWSEVIKEVDEETNDDLEDDVFMNSCERTSLGVDIYIKN